MPTYEYRCGKCGEQLEVYQSFTEAPLTKHKSCGGKLSKVLSPAGIVLKGSGFYKTDSRSTSSKKSSKPKETSTDGSSPSTSSSSDGSSSSSGSGSGDGAGGSSGGTEAKSA